MSYFIFKWICVHVHQTTILIFIEICRCYCFIWFWSWPLSQKPTFFYVFQLMRFWFGPFSMFLMKALNSHLDPLVIWLLSLKQKTTFVLNYKKVFVECLKQMLLLLNYSFVFFGRNSRQWDKKVHSIHSFLWFAFWYIKHINMYL